MNARIDQIKESINSLLSDDNRRRELWIESRLPGGFFVTLYSHATSEHLIALRRQLTFAHGMFGGRSDRFIHRQRLAADSWKSVHEAVVALAHFVDASDELLSPGDIVVKQPAGSIRWYADAAYVPCEYDAHLLLAHLGKMANLGNPFSGYSQGRLIAFSEVVSFDN